MSENSLLTEIRSFINQERKNKFSLATPHITPAKRQHLQKTLDAGCLKSRFLFLPFDHGIEHGPSDFLKNLQSADPEFQLALAKEGKFSGIVLHIGLAEKYWQKPQYKNYLPLLLKLNGKSNIVPDDDALSTLTGTVEDAQKLGADAVGYTLYVGSPRQDEDFLQLLEVRQAAQEAELPLVIWAYPRGKYAEEAGGKDCFALVAYAARLAHELGADITKINAPKPPKDGKYDEKGKFKNYNQLLDLTQEEQLKWAVVNAGTTGVLVSGGSKLSDEDLLNKVGMAVEAGVDGIIFGRNMWQRKYDDALNITLRVKKTLSR